jgi:transcription termination factor Rho
LLLIDERPEEVTDMQRSVQVKYASTLIENRKNTKIANIVLEKQNVWLNVVMM